MFISPQTKNKKIAPVPFWIKGPHLNYSMYLYFRTEQKKFQEHSKNEKELFVFLNPPVFE